MRSGFSSMLVHLGTILLAFGFVIVVIELMASLNGVRHDIAWLLAVVCLGGGALLTGAGAMARRSSRSSGRSE